MYSHVDAVARPVMLQTVAVDEVAAWSAQSGCVGRHHCVMSGQTAGAHVQLLSVIARRHPQVAVSTAMQRIDGCRCQSDARRRGAASEAAAYIHSLHHPVIHIILGM